ncbi:hypothetical protein PHSY_000239 [Pseudozyma hubeiensis SY62]|uniref:BTB domain-containing protein n=1 Tax=Pseudozyma hubeiensis (strain SY62) TaxID=1305764 RepID=R9NW14_PSEHS|nr:hypothetical protein PHSY_000239 [Pseudozyma hubeiensis SY62]GAC92684.1 hypothetical protein PHSY_000239 [Pseudozyma hubeiensis SY62]
MTLMLVSVCCSGDKSQQENAELDSEQTRQGTVFVQLEFKNSDDYPEQAFVSNDASMEIVLSMNVKGTCRSFTVWEAEARFQKQNGRSFDDGIYKIWSLDPKSKTMRDLRFAAGSRCSAAVTIIGYPNNDTSERSENQITPIMQEPKLPLNSLAHLITSSDTDCIRLAPTVPADEKRTLRAHMKTLCNASSYFDSLLRSGFSEAESLRRCVQLSGSSETGEGSSSSDGLSTTKKDSTSDLIRKSFSPVLQVPDMSYSELETLLFYVHTGVAAFARRDRSFRGVRSASSLDNTSTATSQDNKRKRSDSSEGDGPWWKECLDPANAFDMYRIADKYGILGLRQKALGHIRSELKTTRPDPVQFLEDLKLHKEIALFPEIYDLYQEAFMRKDESVLLQVWKDYMSTLAIDR